MLRGIWLSIAFCLSLGAAPEVKFNYKFQPELPRSIRIGKEPVITLASKGKVCFEIVAPASAFPAAQEGAREAAQLLSEALGTGIAVKKAPSGKCPAIIIGDRELAKKAGLDISRIDRDGFFIKTIGKNVLIIGRDDPKKSPRSGSYNGSGSERGTIFGVYDFLERFAGIRFYFPGKLGTVIPKHKEWKLPAIDIYERPDKVQRSTYSSWRPRNITMPVELGKPFNMQQYRLRMRYQSWTWPCCHGLEKQGFIARFAKSHPEYFARNAAGKSVLEFRSDMKEQLCFNSGIREEIYKDALAFLKGRPASERGVRPYKNRPGVVAWHAQLDRNVPVYDITPDDGYYPCRCPKCRKSFPDIDGSGKNKKLSDFMWRYYADAANYVKGHGYIAAWIYWPTLQLPDFKLPDNILFVMCPKGPWSVGNEEVYQRELKRVRTWGELTGSRMRMWNYLIKYPHGSYPGVPTNAPRAVARYYKETAPYTCGAFAEVGVDRFMFQYLNLYVYYKALWTNDLDIEKLLEEHHRLLFGAAAKQMAAFYDQIEKNWLALVGNSVETPEGPKTVMVPDLEIWTKRYSESMMKKMEGFIKAAEAAVPKNSMEYARIRFIKREVWQTVVEQRKRFMETMDQKDSWRMTAVPVEGRIVIDGKLNDKAWNKALPIQLTRFGKGEVNVKTVVRMLYDKENFYFAFENFEPDTGKILAVDLPADDSRRWENSTAEIFLNPDNSRSNHYQLMIDSKGKLTDYQNTRGAFNVKWTSNAEIKTSIEKGKKWIAEVRLPRKSMKGNATAFPVNFTRNRSRVNETNEVYTWNPFMRRFLEVEKWGWCFLDKDPSPSVIKYGDFEVPIRGKRWIGPWYGRNKLVVDHKNFLTQGASVKLTYPEVDSVTQRFKLKPGTEYVVSYFVKLENVAPDGKGGVRARFDECGGNVHWMPRAYLRGTMPWTRISIKIKTSSKCGSKRKKGLTEYLSISLAKGTKGTAWIDRVEIREIKK
ncbi:MAG: DUF4838 domain-containing protein [Lentisphaeria bacterium]|nr:DUF4838 domain-containing protein [Lentisphaeria bacterium]